MDEFEITDPNFVTANEFEETLKMLKMTFILTEKDKGFYKISSPAFVRILSLLSENKNADISQAIKEFLSEKEKFGEIMYSDLNDIFDWVENDLHRVDWLFDFFTI